MNVRGLNDSKKRKDVFKWFKEKSCSVYCIQDTHCTLDQETGWEIEWGFKAYFSSYRGNSRGTAILLNNNFEHKVHRTLSDPGGNFLILDISFEEWRVTLISVYGPNKDDPSFYENLKEKIEDFQNISIIICGDWNMVQDFDLDTDGYIHRNNPNARHVVLDYKEELELVDPWRGQNPEKRRYTWRSGRPVKQARLDFFLVSPDIHGLLDECKISTGYRTDHSMVTLGLNFNEQPRGRGFWKLNSSILKDVEYVNLVKQCIRDTLDMYALPNQDLQSKNVKFKITDQLFWETLKLEIRGLTIPYCSRKKKRLREEEDALLGEINMLEENPSLSERDQDRLTVLRQTLENVRAPKLEATILRAHARWIEHGEKPSKYFCNLEKRNYNSRIIRKLEVDNVKVTDAKSILAEQKNFYENLYRSHTDNTQIPPYDEFIAQENLHLLDQDLKNSCEGQITIEELSACLCNMSNNKSPGSDGFTVEFYKCFWPDFGHFCHRSLLEGYELGQLSFIQRQSVISCLPKGEKPRQYLKNWRPISLLNVDYKMLSAALANRLKTVLPEIISSTQKGFLQGRYIGENTRLVYDIIKYLDENDKTGLLLLIDFEKAFDTVEWEYLNRALKAYNFGENFIRWFNVLYNEPVSCVTNNGYSSQFFQLHRGCRQGDPLSPYLFILAIEPLAAAIKKGVIRGINVEGKEFLIGQYADDTFLLLDGSEESLRNSLIIFRKFHLCSGLKINLEKTCAVWVGRGSLQMQPICEDLGLQWCRNFKLLGITFEVDNMDNLTQTNLNTKIKEAEKVLFAYKRRNLTIIGKIVVVKTIVIPKFVHVLSVLPSPNLKTIQELNAKFSEFIWNSKTGKINRNLLSQDFAKGGLKMTHLVSFIKALKIKWMKNILSEDEGWAYIFKLSLSNIYNQDLWQLDGNSLKQLAKYLGTKNLFWSNIIEAWADLVGMPHCGNDVLNLTMWNAWYMKNDNLKVLQNRFIQNGCTLIRDLYGQDGMFLTYAMMQEKYNIRINFLDYLALQRQIPKRWRNLISNNADGITDDRQLKELSDLFKTNKVCRWAYNKLINVLKINEDYKTKWDFKLGGLEEDWFEYNTIPFSCTQNTKLQAFQYKIIHNILATNRSLTLCKIKDDDSCSFCGESRETIIHLICECRFSKRLWQDLKDVLHPNLEMDNIILSNSNILLGVLDNALLNLILIKAKYYIYACKYMDTKPNIIGLKRQIKKEYYIERQIAQGRRELKFHEKWILIENLVQTW